MVKQTLNVCFSLNRVFATSEWLEEAFQARESEVSLRKSDSRACLPSKREGSGGSPKHSHKSARNDQYSKRSSTSIAFLCRVTLIEEESIVRCVHHRNMGDLQLFHQDKVYISTIHTSYDTSILNHVSARSLVTKLLYVRACLPSAPAAHQRLTAE